MPIYIRRREFIVTLGGAAARPLAAHAQQGERVRRMGVLANLTENDPDERKRMAAFLHALQKLGWREGDNLRIDRRYALGKPENARKYAAELVGLAPDVILAVGSNNTGALIEASRTVPIVFVIVADPVAAGLVESLARPGGNATGFMNFEYPTAGKWLELLKEIAPRVRRVGVLRDLPIAAGTGELGAIQTVAATLSIEVTPIGMRDANEIERGITALARGTNGGLIVTGSPLARVHRDQIIMLAARHQLPAIYFTRFFVAEGGLICYGTDYVDQFRQAADYVDRILKGAKPADLSVQAPTKYELVINIKTAKALGLTVPATLLARADEVIE